MIINLQTFSETEAHLEQNGTDAEKLLYYGHSGPKRITNLQDLDWHWEFSGAKSDECLVMSMQMIIALREGMTQHF